ncbi:MAG: neutral/alkaline non-lysosomal ceramidase N-terminal domain-containing protein [Planctomycetes bacterium]|nr:neutral/alkaline non-lysosomal ceramidase N-terminal domain-containing protein [Planctomycetota bacterium]
MRKVLLAMCAVAAISGVEAFAQDAGWQAGVARTVITPQEPLWMAGYDRGPSQGTAQELTAKALVMQDPEGRRLVLLTTDLLGLDAVLAGQVADEVMQRHMLTRDQIMLTASHTHCGPRLANRYPSTNMPPDEGVKVQNYTDGLRDRLVGVVDAAFADLQPAVLERGRGEAMFAGNRRQPTPEGYINGYNPAGPTDNDVPVLRVTSPQGTLRAIVFGYACHNNHVFLWEWHGDYAGYTQLNLEAAHPGATALFFTGCGGDINQVGPTAWGAENNAQQLTAAIEQVLMGAMTPITGSAQSEFQQVDIPITGETAPDGRTVYPFPVQLWRVGSDLAWVALGGETVVDYSLRIKNELGRETWVTGYANDTMGYVASARVLGEGGYESYLGWAFVNARWGSQVEELIIGKVHELAGTPPGPPPPPPPPPPSPAPPAPSGGGSEGKCGSVGLDLLLPLGLLWLWRTRP